MKSMNIIKLIKLMKKHIFSFTLMLCITQGINAQLISLDSGQHGIKGSLCFANDKLYLATNQGICMYTLDNLLESEICEYEFLSMTTDAVVDFEVHSDTVIALTKSGVYYSIDGGKTSTCISVDVIVPGWKENPYYNGETSLGQISLKKLAVHPSDARKFYVAYKGLSYTEDGGCTWTTVDDFGGHLIEGLFYNTLDGNNLIAYTHTVKGITFDNGAYVYVSTNSAGEWKLVKGYNTGNINTLKHIAFHPTEPNKVMMCGADIYALSENQGLTWQVIVSESSSPDDINPLVYLDYMIYDSRNPDILYGADMIASYEQEEKVRILRSVDGGLSWKTFYTIENTAFVRSMSMLDNLLAITTGNNGIYLLDVDAVDTSISTVEDTPHAVNIHYDLLGRPVAHPTRGIYIKDGKKVAIK